MRVLFLTHRLPYAPNRGDRLRAYHILRALRGHAEVHLFSLVHTAAEASHVGDLHSLAASVTTAPVRRVRGLVRAAAALAAGRPLTHALLDAPRSRTTVAALARAHPPDVVLAFCSGMARFAMQPPLDGLPFVLDMVDVDSQKWAELAGRSPVPQRWIYRREARVLAPFEAAAAARAFATLVVHEREAAILETTAPGARIDVVPNGIDAAPLRPPPGLGRGSRVVFCGVLNYQPNEDAAIWLASEVWPLVRARCPHVRLSLVGADPTRAVRRLAGVDASIDVTGTVRDVRPYLWDAAVSVAPLRISRGVQNKVLEAVAAGLPAVVTPQVAGGLPAEVMSACRVAGDAKSFAGAIVDLLELPPDARAALAGSSDLARLAWNRRLAPLVGILDAAAFGTRDAAGALAS